MWCFIVRSYRRNSELHFKLPFWILPKRNYLLRNRFVCHSALRPFEEMHQQPNWTHLRPLPLRIRRHSWSLHWYALARLFYFEIANLFVVINHCLVLNGGCDLRTTCTNNIGAAPTCGPCPNGYNGTGLLGCTCTHSPFSFPKLTLFSD